MRITVNLATKPFADLGPILRRLRMAMGALAIVALALGIALHFLHSQAEAARARAHSLDGSIARINQERQQAQVMMQQPDNAAVLNQVASLNRLIDTKAFSWTLAMEDLESVLPGGVQVTTLEPIVDKKDGHITVRMRVIGARDKAVELVQNLEHSRHFLQPRITGESAESAGNGQQQLEPVSLSNRVNFDLLADYNAAASAEHKTEPKKKDSEQSEQTPAPTAAATPRTGSPGRQRTPYTGPPPTGRPAPRHTPGGPQ
ncbi:fimbrial assembly protein [Occallatibacter riparius]|uniref:Fimbrial assembly protein n=1 Tax=Occallatibacter riparius TaxID=1002689 RepID=A0A9J7BQ29_9BACT|nr:fimbrial assembly protein [Occallatibacter riparius]UWZ83046.1 fimbrial assembly protein [Occallatibacter riparius]